jgi:hypothetical protein
MQNSESAVSHLIARPVFGLMRAHRRFMIAINGPMLKMLLAGCALAIGAPLNVAAQVLPSEPFVFAEGRVALGGDVSWSMAPEDPGFFNFTDYDHSSLRMIRAALTASVKAGRHVVLLAEIRSENGQRPEAYGVYLRIRPWVARNVDIQVGRIPPTFGAFARRTYAADNPLIGYPLAYQYLTAIRADALPATVDELMRMRGRGWLTNFSIGNLNAEHGVPLANAFRWDTGVQVHAEGDLFDATGSITTGTLSNPRLSDDNGGAQVAGRVAVHPVSGLVLGASASRGPFVTQSALRAVLPGASATDFNQTAWGGDIEYSRGYYIVRVETLVSSWTLPVVRGADTELPLSAVATAVEGRYKIRPGLYAAARFDHLGFSDVTNATTRQSWDAPVTRWEIGGGYSLQRNLLLKIEYQHNKRDGGRVTDLSLVAAQVVFWF